MRIARWSWHCVPGPRGQNLSKR